MLYELVDTATNLFIHANAWGPPRLDAWLRHLLVTPDMHQVHHSARWLGLLLGPFLVPIRVGVITREERHLGRKLGASYRAYRARVRR